MTACTRKFLTTLAASVLLAVALSACGGGGGDGPNAGVDPMPDPIPEFGSPADRALAAYSRAVVSASEAVVACSKVDAACDAAEAALDSADRAFEASQAAEAATTPADAERAARNAEQAAEDAAASAAVAADIVAGVIDPRPDPMTGPGMNAGITFPDWWVNAALARSIANGSSLVMSSEDINAVLSDIRINAWPYNSSFRPFGGGHDFAECLASPDDSVCVELGFGSAEYQAVMVKNGFRIVQGRMPRREITLLPDRRKELESGWALLSIREDEHGYFWIASEHIVANPLDILTGRQQFLAYKGTTGLTNHIDSSAGQAHGFHDIFGYLHDLRVDTILQWEGIVLGMEKQNGALHTLPSPINAIVGNASITVNSDYEPAHLTGTRYTTNYLFSDIRNIHNGGAHADLIIQYDQVTGGDTNIIRRSDPNATAVSLMYGDNFERVYGAVDSSNWVGNFGVTRQ